MNQTTDNLKESTLDNRASAVAELTGLDQGIIKRVLSLDEKLQGFLSRALNQASKDGGVTQGSRPPLSGVLHWNLKNARCTLFFTPTGWQDGFHVAEPAGNWLVATGVAPEMPGRPKKKVKEKWASPGEKTERAKEVSN